MSRNVDLVAVGLLLGGIALYAHTRNFCANAINAHRIGLRSSHVVVVPVPPSPPIPNPSARFMRD
jgi:hypothetical protein